MADSSHSPSLGSPEPKPEHPAKPKGGKPSFEELLKLLVALVDPASKSDAVPKVAEALKKGFFEQVVPEHVEQVMAVLVPYPSLDRLAVRLAVEKPQRSRPLVVALLNRLRAQFASELGFPGSVSREGDRLFELSQWIKVGEESRPTDAPRHPDTWVRKAVLCLSQESDPSIAASAIHRLLCIVARRATQSEGDAFRTDGRSYLRAVGQLLSSKKIVPQRVALSLQFCHPYEDQLAQSRQQNTELRHEAADALQQAQELEKHNAALSQELSSLRDRESKLQQQLAQTQSKLNLEIDRIKELTDHSQRELSQSLAGQRHSLAAAFMHDLQESRLCLDRPEPNVQMALNRIRQMEEVVRKLEQAV